MAVKLGQTRGTKALQASAVDVIAFSGNEIQSQGVCRYHLNFTGANHDVDAIARIRVKSQGFGMLWDCEETHLEALIQRLGSSNPDIVAADAAITIPMDVPDDPSYGRWSCGTPNGQAMTVEVETDGTAAATGTLGLSWHHNTEPLKYFSTFLCSATQIAASSSSMFPCTSRGLLGGFSINTTGLTNVVLYINNQPVLDMAGAALIESQRIDNHDVRTNPIFVRLPDFYPVVGQCGLYIEAGSGWAGAANQVGYWTIVPQVP